MAKINVDASWKLGISKGVVGVVLRDSTGRCLAVKQKVSASSANVAEALAMLEGCLLAQHEHLAHVIMKSD